MGKVSGLACILIAFDFNFINYEKTNTSPLYLISYCTEHNNLHAVIFTKDFSGNNYYSAPISTSSDCWYAEMAKILSFYRRDMKALLLASLIMQSSQVSRIERETHANEFNLTLSR